MCGILGQISFESDQDPATFQTALRTMDHRGPDSFGTWSNPGRTVNLGHTRLQIIDLNGGQQPLSSEHVHAVVNGEFYDFERIREELQSRGHIFSSQSDSEILIHLYKERGTSCLSELRGEFSFLLWDESQQRLFMGRDRFGIRPLYYAIQGKTLYAASEVKALIKLGIRPKWNMRAIEGLHSGLALNQDDSLFEGIYQLKPGHFALFEKNQFRQERYWDFNYPKRTETITTPKSEKDLTTQFRVHFDEAVKHRLRADVEVGVYLSGGVDSSAILGAAQKQSDKKLKAYTLSFEDEYYDELKTAEASAKLAGSDFEPVPVSSKDLLDNFRTAIRHGETVFGNTHGVAKFILSKKVRDQGIKVVMTGEGSDEILGGYAHFRQDLISSLPQDQREQAIAELKEQNKGATAILVAQASANLPLLERRLGHVPSFMRANSLATAQLAPLMNPEFAPKLGEAKLASVLDALAVTDQLEGVHPLNQSLYIWTKTTFPNYQLSVLGDRMEMAHSVEGRPVFLDHPLVEFCAQLPIDMKIKGMNEKYILKEAMKDVLTQEVYERKKMPFFAPPCASDLDSPLFAFYREQLSKVNERTPFYFKPAFDGLMQKLPLMPREQRAQLDIMLTMATGLVTLAEEFGIEA